MNCTTTTTGNCTPNCVHPFRYLFELIYQGVKGPNPKYTFSEGLDRILDKGVVFNNCNLCCPSCEAIYSLSSAETMLKLFEAINYAGGGGVVPATPQPLSAQNFYEGEPCCFNIYASVETYNKVAIAIYPSIELISCCNGFSECVDEVICWITEGVYGPTDKIDRILDLGLSEFSGIGNGCDNDSSQLCYLLDLLKEYLSKLGQDKPTYTRLLILEQIINKGITISCNKDTGEIVIASTETWLKYAEAIDFIPDPFVPPALAQTTTTTTILQ